MNNNIPENAHVYVCFDLVTKRENLYLNERCREK